jgi:hypothetical protein
MIPKETGIVVTITETGETLIEVINGDGKTCTDLTQALEQEIGQVVDRKYKPEHRNSNIRLHQRLQQR